MILRLSTKSFITFNNDNNAQIIEDYIYNIYK